MKDTFVTLEESRKRRNKVSKDLIEIRLLEESDTLYSSGEEDLLMK